jgi:enediyne biosynthesis protein E4
LDNDGDLELVTNNIDQEVLIYENHTTKRSETHFIKLKSTDRSAYNQKVWAYTQGRMQYQELTPYRGFQSSVSSQLHFGLGGYTRVDSIHILFDDSTALKFYNIGADTVLAFSKLNAKRLLFKKDHSSLSFKFKESNFLAYRHHESSPSDIKHTRTLLKELSHAGPCMAVGDVNSDGLDDIFIGGEHGVKASNLFIQLQGGKFRMQKIISDSLREDGDAHFFDANGDGFKDLYVASSCRSSEEHAAKHILYFNDGRGNFKMSSNSIPDINTTSSCVISADYDNDGDLDLFVGGKLKAREYPLSPRSYILRNDGGRFRDVTTDVSKNIQSTGMVTSAVWVDYDNDNKTDLILTGDWMPIKVFRNTDGAHLEDVSTSLGLDNTNGWWNCVKAVDLNNDGFVELIAGNTGENSFFKPTVEEPVKVYAKDFDRNGSVDPIITYFNPVEENRFMIHNRMVIIDQIPAIKKRFERFRQFATTPFINSFRSDEIEDAVIQDVYMLRSVILANKNGKKFSLIDLPEVAQLSTINDVCVDDVNADGNLDILAVGNNYTQETFFGRYNASLGVLLLGDGKLNWSSIEPRDCGLVADKNAKYVRKTIINGIQHYAVVNNNDSLQLFQVVRTAQAMAEN